MKTGKSIRGALNYNEKKVRQGTAELILASHFGRDISEMGFSEKLMRFDKLIGFNEKSQTNTLHLSLNFSPEDRLDSETLQKIASDYMERIGFGRQPYLVYQHNDTNHPHIHIVTTTIKPNGKPIYLHNIGKRLSEPARKAIEQEYGLIQAEGRKKKQALPLQPVTLKAAYYGKSETKRIISNIVREVVSRYRYTSLDELNAVLRQYNVVADRGSEKSPMYQNRGLVYSIIDKNGYKVGIPVKASSIFTSPTLSALEKKFEQNRVTRPAFQNKVQSKILSALNQSNSSILFMEKLKERNIGCSVLYESTGTIKNINFVDHTTRTVFSCEDLGFRINSILEQLSHPQTKNSGNYANSEVSPINDENNIAQLKTTASFDILKTLLTTESHQPDLSSEFLKKRKKRRKR